MFRPQQFFLILMIDFDDRQGFEATCKFCEGLKLSVVG